MWRILLARSQFVFPAAAPTAHRKDLLHKGLDDWIVLGNAGFFSVEICSFGSLRGREIGLDKTGRFVP